MVDDIVPYPVAEGLSPAISQDVAVAALGGIAGGIVGSITISNPVICVLFGYIKAIGTGVFRDPVELGTGYIMNGEAIIRLDGHQGGCRIAGPHSIETLWSVIDLVDIWYSGNFDGGRRKDSYEE